MNILYSIDRGDSDIIRSGYARPNSLVLCKSCSKDTYWVSRVEFSYGSLDLLLDRQVEGAIYAADVTLLKYFNLFDTNPARREPYDEVPLIPPADAFFTNNATAIPLPLTQGVEVTVPPQKTELQFKQLIMTFGSIVFTRTMVSSVDCLLSNIMPSPILALQAPKTARGMYCT